MMMKSILFLIVCGTCLTAGSGVEASDDVLLEDDFNRTESSPEKEEIGNGWSTNSAKRAKGVKQVDLVDGAMHITRAEVADHGVSVVHDVSFRNATITLRFKLDGKKDDLGINIADMKEKSVHAGHICVARVRSNSIEISDLKMGAMKNEHRAARQAKDVSREISEAVSSCRKMFKYTLSTGEWNELAVRISGQRMTVRINDKTIGTFESPGIGHPTKRRLRLSVNKSAWVDDLRIVGSR